MKKSKPKVDLEKVNSLLNRIIQKGGLIGRFAKIYCIGYEKTDLFIRECADCNTQSLETLWGKELARDVLNYINENNNVDNV